MNNLDFLNLNTLRNYPIKDGAACISTDDLFKLPNDLIADITIAAPATDIVQLYISKVVNSSESISLELSNVDNSEVVGTFFIAFTGFEVYGDYAMTASVNYPGALGRLTAGYIKDIKGQPSGEFLFAPTATPLLYRTFIPAALGVNYVSFTDTKGNEVHLTGNVRLHAENNLRFRTSTTAEETVVILDAGNGLGLNKDCDEDLLVPPIKTINGILPDSTGDFHLITEDCVSITPIEAGLLISDSCGKPCLGCNELGTLTSRAISVENELLKIRDYVTNLENLITQLTTLVNYQCDCE